jgi:hypothetical protein
VNTHTRMSLMLGVVIRILWRLSDTERTEKHCSEPSSALKCVPTESADVS